MKYTMLMKSYLIDENDGSGPFPKEAESIIISYDSKSGKPISVIMTAATSIEGMLKHGGPRMKEEKDSSKLAKIVEYFHQK